MGNENSGRRPNNSLDYKEVGMMYFDQGWTQQRLADRYGVDRCVIIRNLDQYRQFVTERDLHTHMMEISPPGATHYSGSAFYKIGLRGLVYRWNDIEWVRNSMSKHDMISSAVKL
jgi:hypothetical protein